jgi:hypothetical protein
MPALITARSRQQATVVQQLRECLLELPRLGIAAFRFKDLLDPLKKDARRRWAALLGEKEEIPVALLPGAGQVPAPALAGSAAESRQSFEDLTRCISASIDHLEADVRTRTQLSALWHYLGRQHGEEDEGAGRNEPDREGGSARRVETWAGAPRRHSSSRPRR